MNGVIEDASEDSTLDAASSLQNTLFGESEVGVNLSESSSESQPNASSEADPPSSGADDESARPSTGDPLYDARADSEDEQWVKRNLIRRSTARPRHSGSSSASGSKGSSSNDTAFQLSCPSCFTLLCVQCQPHERHEGQFRALFVRNCVTKSGETQRVRVTVEGKDAANSPRELFRPVACAKCGADVAVQDADDVYHFCNVIY